MKILQVNNSDTGGGAAAAASRLNRGLRVRGVDSRMLVQFKSDSAEDVIGPLAPVERLKAELRCLLDLLPAHFYRSRRADIFSPAVVPDRLTGRVAKLDPDLVNLHWLGAGFCRLESLSRLGRPLVWTLHDSWAFTGGCHLPGDCTRYLEMCGACPLLGSERENDLSRRVWKRKKSAWRAGELTVVAPSRWMANRACSSSLLADSRIEVIPNGLDLTLFKPIEKKFARNLLNFPADKKLVMFGAFFATEERNKGYHLLQPAIQSLAANGWAERTELVVFGASRPANAPDLGLKCHYVGHLHDDITLALHYAAADVFVAPSKEENLPFTVMEALACGTPCVAFRTGGVPELIDHQQNGYLVTPFEIDDLARGIAWVLENDGRHEVLSLSARQKVAKEFDLNDIAKRYLQLYEDLLGGLKRRLHG
jgi:glycosyltransferase involved in cell wall biosynthesis